MTGPLLNNRDLMARLGLSARTFYSRKREGYMKQFEVCRPMGTRRYSPALVEEFLRGASTVKFGSGARRAS